jgi:long-chain acyl-CoA synthetase
MDRLVHHLLERAARTSGERPWLQVGGAAVASFGELQSRAQRVAEALLAAGVGRGDRVLLYANPDADFVAALFGTFQAGAVAVPLHPRTPLLRLRAIAEDTGAAALCGDAGQLATAATAAAGLPWPAARIDVASLQAAPAAAAPRLATRDDACIDADLALIIYTSGSTGDHKGVMLTHRNVLAALDSIASYLGYRADDRVLLALPLSFDYGLYQVFLTLCAGARLVINRSAALPSMVAETIRDGGVTVVPAVPMLVGMLGRLVAAGAAPFEAVRMLTNTGAALTDGHLGMARVAFPKAEVYSMYGLTECKRVSYLPPAEAAAHPGSVGRGMPHQELWVQDEQGNRLPPGSTGELVVRGAHVMAGYWRRPEASAAVLRPGPLPGEQVLLTGDIFRMDEAGYLYFQGRRDDIIKSRGEKVSPREVEAVLSRLPGVTEVAVFGLPDPVVGEAVTAVIGLVPGACLNRREVLSHCNQSLYPHMVPSRIEFATEEFPRTETGKLDRRAVRAQWLAVAGEGQR